MQFIKSIKYVNVIIKIIVIAKKITDGLPAYAFVRTASV